MRKSIIGLFVLASSTITACATTGTGSNAGDYQSMITQAEEAYNAVDKAGGAWRDTGDLITEAKKEAESGNKDKAYTLASEAYEQSKLASEQLESQKKAGPWLF